MGDGDWNHSENGIWNAFKRSESARYSLSPSRFIEIIGRLLPSVEPEVPSIPLETMILKHDISFPSLTHVTLGSNAMRHLEFLPLLCTIAPNLYDPDLTVNRFYRPATTNQPFPSFRFYTSLRRLSLLFEEGATEERHYIGYLVHHSRLLKSLSIEYAGSVHTYPAVLYFCKMIAKCSKLVALRWQVQGPRGGVCQGVQRDGGSK